MTVQGQDIECSKRVQSISLGVFSFVNLHKLAHKKSKTIYIGNKQEHFVAQEHKQSNKRGNKSTGSETKLCKTPCS